MNVFAGARVVPQRILSVIRDVLAVALPTVGALILAQVLAFHDQSTRAQIMAGVVLDRAAQTTDQLAAAFATMDSYPPEMACSSGAMATMRRVDLGSSLLQGVGYIRNDTLLCSSLGERAPMTVGAPDYVSATKTTFRRARALTIAPETPLLLVSDARGFTGLVHPGLVFGLAGPSDGLASGLISVSTRELILKSGDARFDWTTVTLPPEQKAGLVTLDGQLVAWQRSPRWDHFAYAAVPLTAVASLFAKFSLWLLPLGVAIGFAILLVMRRLIAVRASLPSLLKNGLARGELYPVYQPIVDMRTGRWVGAEVLARWRQPNGDFVSPDVFVAIAERHGLIGKLTRTILEASTSDMADLVRGRPGFYLSVNIASADLREPDFVDFVTSCCRARGLGNERLHLEITERNEVDAETAAETIRTLRGLGLRVGIDDFGIGYSNLAYLDLLQVDYLKIDRVFVAAIDRGAIGSEIVDHIIELANARHLEVVAEGIETAEQRAALLSRGVAFGQGWLFGRPMSALDFARLYVDNQTRPSETPPPHLRVA